MLVVAHFSCASPSVTRKCASSEPFGALERALRDHAAQAESIAACFAGLAAQHFAGV
jgi:hypothetical protein